MSCARPSDVMRYGFTIVELMVCIVLAVILAASMGPSVVRLVRVHESLREEGFIREKLVTLAGIYSDWLSLAKSVAVYTNTVAKAEDVIITTAYYPQETEGISLETNNICKVTACHSTVSNGMWNVWFDTKDPRFPNEIRKLSFDGDAMLEHASARIVDVILQNIPDTFHWNLSLLATNQFWDVEKDAYSVRTVRTERIIQLWNGGR